MSVTVVAIIAVLVVAICRHRSIAARSRRRQPNGGAAKLVRIDADTLVVPRLTPAVEYRNCRTSTTHSFSTRHSIVDWCVSVGVSVFVLTWR